MNEEINKIFEQWKQFLSWCYENNDKTTEIHRDNLERVMAYTRQLENIIKGVREYIKTNMEIRKNCENVYSYDIRNNDYIKQVDVLLEILDKENNK